MRKPKKAAAKKAKQASESDKDLREKLYVAALTSSNGEMKDKLITEALVLFNAEKARMGQELKALADKAKRTLEKAKREAGEQGPDEQAAEQLAVLEQFVGETTKQYEQVEAATRAAAQKLPS